MPKHVREVTSTYSGETAIQTWVGNYKWAAELTIQEDVRRVRDDVWLVLLGELPDPDDDPDIDEREADEELQRRRMSFRRY